MDNIEPFRFTSYGFPLVHHTSFGDRCQVMFIGGITFKSVLQEFMRLAINDLSILNLTLVFITALLIEIANIVGAFSSIIVVQIKGKTSGLFALYIYGTLLTKILLPARALQFLKGSSTMFLLLVGGVFLFDITPTPLVYILTCFYMLK